MKLNEKIARRRRQAGLSQEALAEQIGVSRQAISKWETGEASPEISKLPLRARAFGVTADWLLNEEEEAAEPDVDPMPAQEEPPRRQYSDEAPRNTPSWVDDPPGILGRLVKRWGCAGMEAEENGTRQLSACAPGKLDHGRKGINAEEPYFTTSPAFPHRHAKPDSHPPTAGRVLKEQFIRQQANEHPTYRTLVCLWICRLIYSACKRWKRNAPEQCKSLRPPTRRGFLLLDKLGFGSISSETLRRIVHAMRTTPSVIALRRCQLPQGGSLLAASLATIRNKLQKNGRAAEKIEAPSPRELAADEVR